MLESDAESDSGCDSWPELGLPDLDVDFKAGRDKIVDKDL